MSDHDDSLETADTTNPKLKALQRELTESNKEYIYQCNKLQELLAKANQEILGDQNNPKVPNKITFKKPKSQLSDQLSHDQK